MSTASKVFFLSEQFEVGRSISLDVLLEPKTTWFGCAMHLAARVSPNLGSAWCTYATLLCSVWCLFYFALQFCVLLSSVLPLFLDACCGWPCPALFSPPSDLQRSLPVLNPNCIPLFPVWAPRLKIALFGLGHPGNVPIQSTLLFTMTESIVMWDDYFREATNNTVMIELGN